MLRQHVEAPKIIKQIMESFDGELTEEFQVEMINMICEKMTVNKSKAEHLEGILSIVLSL